VSAIESVARTPTIRFVVSGLAVLALLLAPAGSGPAQSSALLSSPSVPVPPSYFAMNILFHPLNMKYVPWPSVPLGGWRTSHVAWADLEPERGRWYFDLLDKYVAMSQAHRLEILMPLTYTPRWASSTPDAATDVAVNNPPGLSGAPRDMEDWRTFVRTVATRYKGRIHNWEIWNEPNRPQSWTGSVETMVEMAREAYTILKQVDPANFVVSPAPSGGYGLKFFDAFLSKGGGQYADAIGFHFYVGHDDPPEAMVTLIGTVKKIVDKYGLGAKPIWSTEAGWLGPEFFPPSTQAAYVARAYILNWASGVTRFYWFAWENHRGTRIELVGADNATLTPAGKAFATIQEWMTGAVVSRCTAADTGVWTCNLERTGRSMHLLWSTRGDTRFPIPAAWHASQANALDGGTSMVQNGTLSIGIAPVLIQ
jgi:hypothetical protein